MQPLSHHQPTLVADDSVGLTETVVCESDHGSVVLDSNQERIGRSPLNIHLVKHTVGIGKAVKMAGGVLKGAGHSACVVDAVQVSECCLGKVNRRIAVVAQQKSVIGRVVPAEAHNLSTGIDTGSVGSSRIGAVEVAIVAIHVLEAVRDLAYVDRSRQSLPRH